MTSPTIDGAMMQLTDEQIAAITETYAKRWKSSGAWNVKRCIDNALRDARALLSASKPAAPEGFALVPVDPTQSMRDAGNRKLNELATEPGMGMADRAFYAYNAMLAAAPAAPAQYDPNERLGTGGNAAMLLLAERCGISKDTTNAAVIRFALACRDDAEPARSREPVAWPAHDEAVATYKEIRAQTHRNPIGYIEASEFEKLGDPQFGSEAESHVRLWHAANPPSRALLPVYTSPQPSQPAQSDEAPAVPERMPGEKFGEWAKRTYEAQSAVQDDDRAAYSLAATEPGFEAAWPEIHRAGGNHGWRGVALAAWRLATARAASPQATNSDVIARAKRIMVLVDEYVDKPSMATRSTLRGALVDEFEASPQATATLTEDVLMQAIADTAARGHVWASRALSDFRAARKATATQPAQTDDARDAARYRWLRNEHFPTADNPPLAQVVWKAFDDRHSSDWANMIDGNDLDRAIDAALLAAQPASGADHD